MSASHNFHQVSVNTEILLYCRRDKTQESFMEKLKSLMGITGTLVLAYPSVTLAETINVTVNLTDTKGIGEKIGTITLEDTEYGMLLTPNLVKLNPGIHGFHVHENPDCNPGEKDGKIVPGLAAGGHYDPSGSGSHEGPYGNGHLGDLPPLFVNADGTAQTPVLAPRLKTEDVKGRSLMIHLMGDNFSDDPKPLGGGGARLACGIISE